jgi:hypothetical protein
VTDAAKQTLTMRRASVADAPAVLRLFDEVIAWFVAIGNPQQWGSEAWSSIPRRITQVTDACALPGAWVAETAQGEVRAFLALGDAMPYVPAAVEPELYVPRVSLTCAWIAMPGAVATWCVSTNRAVTNGCRPST